MDQDQQARGRTGAARGRRLSAPWDTWTVGLQPQYLEGYADVIRLGGPTEEETDDELDVSVQTVLEVEVSAAKEAEAAESSAEGAWGGTKSPTPSAAKEAEAAEPSAEGAWGGTRSPTPSATSEAPTSEAPSSEAPKPGSWEAIEAELVELRETIRGMEIWEVAAFRRFDEYCRLAAEDAHPDAAVWAGRVQDRREEQAAIATTRRARSLRRREDEQREEAARKELEDLRLKREKLEKEVRREKARKAEADRRARQVEEQLHRVRMNEEFAQSQARQQQAYRDKKRAEGPRCYVCGQPGVRNSATCPNKSEHEEIREKCPWKYGKKQ